MTVVNVKSKEEFDAAIHGTASAAVHFWATWCEPCTHMDVVFAELSAENPRHKFLRVEAEEVPDISEKYEVSAVPFFLFFKDGKVVDRLEGANPPELASKITRHLAAPAAATSATAQPGPSITGAGAGVAVLEEVLLKNQAQTTNGTATLTPGVRKRLEELLKAREVMLFMKGVPDAPRCGFSSKVVKALQDLGVEFGTFDILSDQEVRQGLKEYSNWPTYPQLYCRGELVGGCDIILDMYKSGELKDFFADEGILPTSA